MMSNSSLNSTTPATVNVIVHTPSPLKGVSLLLTLIYAVIIGILIVFFVKRAISRVSFSQCQTEPGTGGSKNISLIINAKLDEAIDLAYEPKLLEEGDSRLKTASSHLPTAKYLYRMKTVDAFRDIDGVLADVNKELKRPMGKSIRQHLLDAKSHSSGCMRSVRTNQLQALSDLYFHAKCGAEPFGASDYKKYTDMSADLVSTLRHRTRRKKSKDKRKELHRQNALSFQDSKDSRDVDDVEQKFDDAQETVQETTTMLGAEVSVEIEHDEKVANIGVGSDIAAKSVTVPLLQSTSDRT